MLGRSRNRDRGRGAGVGGINLLNSATIYLGGVAPYHWLDFIANRALYAGIDVGNVTQATGYSFARASVGSYRNADGTTTQFASGALRRGDRGVLIEGARTNLFLNSATGATQSVTVAAAAHTLSFEGTGTVTLTGVSTAGPLVGTGALNRVSLTFTPTAGSLTLTITGTVERVNLEAGSFGSSWIPTAGSSVARAADVLTYTAGVSYPLSLWAEFERAVDTGGETILLQVDDGGGLSESSRISITGADLIYGQVIDGGVEVFGSSVAGALSVGVRYKSALRSATNSARAARDGTLSNLDTSVALPNTPTIIRIGAAGASPTAFSYFSRWAIVNSALSDTGLQGITS